MSSNQLLQDRIVGEMLEEFNPLLDELKEGIYQYSILYHKPFNDLLAEVAKHIMEK